MNDVSTRLDDYVEKARRCLPASETVGALRPPVSEADLDAVDNVLAPYRLPEWLRELYRWHDGADERLPGGDTNYLGYLFGTGFFLSLFEALKFHSESMVQDLPWRPFWFALTFMDSDGLMCTLDYKDQATDPTIFRLSWEDHTPTPVYDSFDSCLTQLLGGVEGAEFWSQAWGSRDLQTEALSLCEALRKRTWGPAALNGADQQHSWTKPWRDRAGLGPPAAAPISKMMTEASAMEAGPHLVLVRVGEGDSIEVYGASCGVSARLADTAQVPAELRIGSRPTGAIVYFEGSEQHRHVVDIDFL